MPLATNPKAICIEVLDSDLPLPEADQPKFYYHYLTGLEQMDLAQKMDDIEMSGTGKEAVRKVFELAATHMTGWTNIRDKKGAIVTFDPKKLSSIMGLSEAQELIQKLLLQSPSVMDKKKLDSQSESNTAKSAKTAKGQESAKTSQPK